MKNIFTMGVILFFLLGFAGCRVTGPDPAALMSPVLNHPSGTYTGPLTITNTRDYSVYTYSAGVKFKYTLDGSRPQGSPTAVMQDVLNIILTPGTAYTVNVSAFDPGAYYYDSMETTAEYTIVP